MHATRRLFSSLLCLAALAAGCGGGGGEAPFGITALGLVGGPTGDVAAADTAGGDTVVVLGGGFVDGAAVSFGVTPAAAVTYVGAGELRAVTPPMAPGTFDLVVTNPDGESVRSAGAFTFGTPPTALAVVAVDGAFAGEAKVSTDVETAAELTGTGFEAGTEVFVNGIAAPATFVDANTLSFDAPSLAVEQIADIVVRTPPGFVARLDGMLFYSQEASLAPHANALDDADLHHLFRRAGFGATPALLAVERNRTLEQTVNGLLGITINSRMTAVENAALALYGDAALPGPDVSSRANQEWWIHIIRHTPYPLQERMAFFLHDHFATSQSGFGANERWWMHEQIQLFRRFPRPGQIQGMNWNWEDLLVRVCKDRAMLDWLDGIRSTANAPNENFARELWELFMLGEGRGYTQADIVEASKAFTGFDDISVDTDNDGETDYRDMRYFKNRHDPGPKTILGVTGNFGYDDLVPFHEDGATIDVDQRDTNGGVVALTLAQRPVEASTFLCEKLAVHFLYDDPPQSVVDELARILRDNDWNLRPVMETILRSKAMFSSRARKSQIQAPVDYLFGFLNTMELDTTESRIRNALGDLGQSLMQPPDVDGWPRGNAWMGGQAMVERIDFVRLVIQDLDNTPADIEPLLPPAGSRSPAQLVDHLAARMDVELTAEARQGFVDYVNSTLDGDDNVIPFAFDPDDATDLRMKTRGLIYLIAQYHDAHRQ